MRTDLTAAAPLRCAEYQPLAEAGTWAYLEITDSNLFTQPLPDVSVRAKEISRTRKRAEAITGCALFLHYAVADHHVSPLIRAG